MYIDIPSLQRSRSFICRMLSVLKTSGEEALNIELAALQEAAPVEEQAVRVIDVKRYLHRSCSQPPRFRQRLLREDGQILSDDVALDESLDVQLTLVLLPFEASSEDQIIDLQDAASQNSIPRMEQILQRPQDPDLEGAEDSDPALHEASWSAGVEAVRLLLEARADKDQISDSGRTALSLSSTRGRLDIVQLLLDANADKDKAGMFGRTPLMLACLKGHVNIARLLLEGNADKDKADDSGCTPVWYASLGARSEVLRLLLEARADMHKAAKDGSTPFDVATMEGHLEVALLLRPKSLLGSCIATTSKRRRVD